MKRTILALLFILALALPVWGAARTLYPAHSAMNWSDSTWALSDGGTADEAKPEAGDTVYFTANSGDVTVDEDVPLAGALYNLQMDYETCYAGTLALGSYTLTVDGTCELQGTITGTGTIDAGEGMFIQGATVADAITLLLTTSGAHYIYGGGTGGSININCTGTYTLQNAISAYAFTMTAGTLVGGSQTVTLNGGDLTYTAGTLTGDLNVTFAVSGSGNWDTAAGSYLHLLTVDATQTLTLDGNLDCKAVSAAGTVALGANRLYIYPAANDFLTVTGSIGGTGDLFVYPGATSRSNSGGIVLADSATLVVGFDADDKTITQSSDIEATSGNTLQVYGDASKYCHLILNGNLTGYPTIQLGNAASGTRQGRLTLGSGVYQIGSLARVGTATGHQFNPGGHVRLSGTFDGTEITTTPTSEGQIDCLGTGRVTAVTSTGRRLVVRRAVDAAGMPLRAWQSDSCVNVMFKGRKVIGEPGVN